MVREQALRDSSDAAVRESCLQHFPSLRGGATAAEEQADETCVPATGTRAASSPSLEI